MLGTYSHALDEDGIAAPGQIIRNHDVYVNKQSPKIVDRRGAGAPLKDMWALACIVLSLLFCSIFACSILYLWSYDLLCALWSKSIT